LHSYKGSIKVFAKLVTVSNNSVSANVFFNSLISLITGTLTANTDLNPSTFNQSASYIINTVAPGWSVVDSQANLVGYSTVLPGRPPVVIAAPWTDSPDYAKYLWITPSHSSNTVLNIAAIPSEGWYSNVKSFGANGTIAPLATIATQYSNTTGGNGNNASFFRGWNDIIGPMGNDLSTNGTVTIVSASQSHLLVVSYRNLTGTSFNNYFFLSEDSRDDPWNTVGNGYPSWYVEGASNTAGQVFNAERSSLATNAHGGYVARMYNTANNVDYSFSSSPASSMTPTATFLTVNSNWGVTSRYINWNGYSSTIEGISRPYIPRGLAQAGIASFYLGNNNNARDVNRSPAFGMSELKLTPLTLGTGVGISQANNIWVGGSINAKTPYLYLFRSQYQSLDEISFGGSTWMNLILNSALAGTTNASCIIVKEV
jgi:hypothetical protein